jgi:hypothetical protein
MSAESDGGEHGDGSEIGVFEVSRHRSWMTRLLLLTFDGDYSYVSGSRHGHPDLWQIYFGRFRCL